MREGTEEGVSNLLFRGSKMCKLGVKINLERNTTKFLTMGEFSKEIKSTKYAFESCFGVSRPTETKFVITEVPSPPEYYEFMLYLRHHGYPTPLFV